MVTRILNFHNDDWQHIFWLFKQMCKGFYEGNILQIEDSWNWICFHCKYDSKKIK
jgi:hypothetical protein